MHNNAAVRILARTEKIDIEKGIVQPRLKTIKDLKYRPTSRLSQTVILILNYYSISQYT
jgi:hypothetical protein